VSTTLATLVSFVSCRAVSCRVDLSSHVLSSRLFAAGATLIPLPFVVQFDCTAIDVDRVDGTRRHCCCPEAEALPFHWKPAECRFSRCCQLCAAMVAIAPQRACLTGAPHRHPAWRGEREGRNRFFVAARCLPEQMERAVSTSCCQRAVQKSSWLHAHANSACQCCWPVAGVEVVILSGHLGLRVLARVQTSAGQAPHRLAYAPVGGARLPLRVPSVSLRLRPALRDVVRHPLWPLRPWYASPPQHALPPLLQCAGAPLLRLAGAVLPRDGAVPRRWRRTS